MRKWTEKSGKQWWNGESNTCMNAINQSDISDSNLFPETTFRPQGIVRRYLEYF